MPTETIDYRLVALDYPYLRRDMLDTLIRYAEDHLETGGYTRGLLEGDLRQAIRHAHPSIIVVSMAQTLDFIEAELPAECHGSPEKVAAWLNRRQS